MRMISLVSVVISLTAAGCAPTGKWHRVSDGLAADSNSTILQTFESDRAVCDGEAAKAALASQEKNRIDHANSVNLVYRGCLAGKGWKFVGA